MKNYDFNDFLKAIKHFDQQDKLEATKLKLAELEKNRTSPQRKEAAAMAEKVKEYLHTLVP